MSGSIVDLSGLTPAAAYLKIQTILAYPLDGRAQATMFRNVFDEAQQQLDRPTFTPSSYLARAVEFEAGGGVAGEVALFLVRKLKHHPSVASVAKAQFMVSRALSVDMRTVKRHWARFQPVSTIFGAYYLAREVYSIDDPRWIAGVANSISIEISDRYGQSTHYDWVQIADGGRLYQPPKDFVVPPLTESQAEMLTKYRAPTRDN